MEQNFCSFESSFENFLNKTITKIFKGAFKGVFKGAKFCTRIGALSVCDMRLRAHSASHFTCVYCVPPDMESTTGTGPQDLRLRRRGRAGADRHRFSPIQRQWHS